MPLGYALECHDAPRLVSSVPNSKATEAVLRPATWLPLRFGTRIVPAFAAKCHEHALICGHRLSRQLPVVKPCSALTPTPSVRRCIVPLQRGVVWRVIGGCERRGRYQGGMVRARLGVRVPPVEVGACEKGHCV